MSELFRKEAVEYAARRLDGEVVLVNILPVRILIATFAIIVAAACVFASVATYARKETVVGWLTPDRGLLRVVARQGGLITSLAVEEGDSVEAGAPLAELLLSSDLADGENVGEILAQSLAAESRATLARLQAQEDRLHARADNLRTQRTAMEGELAEARRQLELQEERAALAQAQVERAQAMADRGVISQRDLELRLSEGMAAELALSDSRSRIQALERNIASLTADLDAVPLELAALQAEAAATQASLSQREADAQSRSVYVVTSPVSGRVAALPLQAGQTLGPGGLVAVVVPHDSRLVAELYVPTRAAGFIREGQDVRLMYQAFPHQRFGAGSGRITEVSNTVLGPDDVALPALAPNEPVFRTRVELREAHVDAYGEKVPLQPGMLLTADIVIDRRTLWEWVLDPLYAAARR